MKKVIIIILIVVIIIISFISFNFLNKESNEESIKNDLIKIGKEYYEDYYYVKSGNSSEERSKELSKYVNTGIRINIETLSLYSNDFNNIINTFINNETNEVCNKNNTKVIIYPKSPYTKTDYTIDTILDCAFNE